MWIRTATAVEYRGSTTSCQRPVKGSQRVGLDRRDRATARFQDETTETAPDRAARNCFNRWSLARERLVSADTRHLPPVVTLVARSVASRDVWVVYGTEPLLRDHLQPTRRGIQSWANDDELGLEGRKGGAGPTEDGPGVVDTRLGDQL